MVDNATKLSVMGSVCGCAEIMEWYGSVMRYLVCEGLEIGQLLNAATRRARGGRFAVPMKFRVSSVVTDERQGRTCV